jgi:hypothetical protein
MKTGHGLKALGTSLVFLAAAIASVLLSSPRGRADDRDDHRDRDDARIEQGFDIAPVPLHFDRKDRDLVGLGSYIVNTEGCDDCHSAGPPTEYAPGHNPFFGQTKMVNPKTYLGGGRDFGELVPPPGIGSAHIISRNLTPTPKTGLPEGDHTFVEFLEIFRTGKDFDLLHPTCTGAPNPGCIPKPFDGNLLQIMPWPNFKDLTDHDIRAIYEYLKAVPCIQGNYPGEPADRCAP